MTYTEYYEGRRIKIVTSLRNSALVYYISIDDKLLTFVSREAYALSLAKRYIDVTNEDAYFSSRKRVAGMGKVEGNC